MINILLYIAVFIAGGITALLYLWLLHFSVINLIRKSAPSWFAFFGFFFRLVLCGACFFLASLGGHFDRLAVSVLGFTIVRIIAVNVIRSFPVLPKSGKGEKNDN